MRTIRGKILVVLMSGLLMAGCGAAGSTTQASDTPSSSHAGKGHVGKGQTGKPHRSQPSNNASTGSAETPQPSATTVSTPPGTRIDPDSGATLVRWRKPVEQIFVHPLILQPKLAFTGDSLSQGFADYFVTDGEFERMLDQLWANGWTLVDARKVAARQVWVPQGRKPLVLIEDDVNYYKYFDGRGLARRLVLDANGAVMAELPDGTLSGRDVVPMVEAMVAEHPEFAAQGARGVLALTGFEGFFGERDLSDPDSAARARALATALTDSGWDLASHSYGHINLTNSSVDAVAADARKWQQLAEPILGSTELYVYPFGARPSPAATRALAALGFTTQWDIDIVPRLVRHDGAVVLSRRHIDGYAFAVPERLRPFFDVAKVRDPLRPAP